MHRIDGAGHVDHLFVAEDPATLRPPTEITPEIMNVFQEELATFIEWAGIVLAKGNNTQLRQALVAKFAGLNETTIALAGRIQHFATGVELPAQDIGPIWHADYNSLMVWQAFTANGANYTGYASVLVGSLLLDTQPTARPGYIKSGVANLSRTAYAALRGWAIHNGIMVAAGVWSAGRIAVADNADGTTFKVFDVRGEFPRAWDDSRGVDSGRAFGSAQADELKSHLHTAVEWRATGFDNTGGPYPVMADAAGAAGVRQNITENTGGSETRPRNIALLACIKF